MTENLNTHNTDQTFSYPERLSMDGPEYTPIIESKEWEKNTENYFEWEWDYKETRRALNLDFKHFVEGLPEEKLRQFAMPFLEDMNKSLSQEGKPTIDVASADTDFIKGIIKKPDWQEKIPANDSDEEMKHWSEFKSQFPENMQINLEGLREADFALRSLANNEELRREVEETRSEKLICMRAAVGFMRAEKKKTALSREITRYYVNAQESNRPLTKSEQKKIEEIKKQISEIESTKGEELRNVPSPEMQNEVKSYVHLLINRERRRDYEKGIVLTSQMKKIIDDLLPALIKGQPALLVGETGGAKTALAEFISKTYFEVEPELISGYGEVNTYQIMGKMTLKDGESVFEPGPLVRAMEEGRPVILDEMNAMPADILKRLNKIVQLRPGDTFTVQEDGGREIVIKNGFVIIATANEKSKRYKGVDDLSVEFQNRFGANVVRVRYPDDDVVYGQLPRENMIIATAALTDHKGEILPVIENSELERFVSACHISQQVFTGNYGEGFSSYVSAERTVDKKPGLEETVLAPRTMVALLEKLRDSHGQLTMDRILENFLDGIKNPNDKAVLKTILVGQGFLKTPETID